MNWPTTLLNTDVHRLLEGYYGETQLKEILVSLAIPPSMTTLRVNTQKIDPKEALQRLKQYFEAVMPAIVPMISLHPAIPDCIQLPCTGIHEFPDKFAQILVDTKCGEAVMRGADIFAPGVLGAATGIKPNNRVSVYVDLDGKVNKGERVNFEVNKQFIGNGIALMSRSKFYTTPSGVGVKMIERVFNTPPLNGVLEDLLFLQNLPSMLVAHALCPQPGETILDMCASPGGKTTHIAALMKNQGKLFAIDKTEGKVKLIQELCTRLGVTCVTALVSDSTRIIRGEVPPTKKKKQEQSRQDHTFDVESFDRILLDPPCSGLGQRPRFKETMSLATLQGYSPYQRKLFHVAAKLLKVGGTLVYSTCTINPQENEEMVHFAVNNFPLRLVRQEVHIGEHGLRTASGQGTPLTEEQLDYCQRFDPSAKLDTIGFFIAKFEKVKIS